MNDRYQEIIWALERLNAEQEQLAKVENVEPEATVDIEVTLTGSGMIELSEVPFSWLRDALTTRLKDDIAETKQELRELGLNLDQDPKPEE